MTKKIIAYGEQELTTQTQGQDGGLLEFEIPLDYRSLTRIPSYIVIVALCQQIRRLLYR